MLRKQCTAACIKSVKYENILFHKTEEYRFHQVENHAQSSTCTSIDIQHHSPNPKTADTTAAWKKM